MELSYFTTNNKSGHKTKESWFIKNHLKEYESIINYCGNKLPKDSSFKEKIWFYFNQLTNTPKCQSCNSDVKFSERFDRGYNQFCSLECANNSGLLLEKQKSSNLKNHGVEYYTQHKDFVKKQKQTKLVKHGDENYNNINQIRKTKLDRYGDEKWVNVNKAKETNLKKYGVDNPSKSEEIVNKIISKFNDKYGYNSPSQSPEIKEKIKLSILNKIKSKFQSNEFVNYDFNKSEYELNCLKCNSNYHISMPLYNERNRLGYCTCTSCNPIGIPKTSSYENEIIDYIKTIYKGEVKNGVRNLIKQEVDIFIPEFNFGIEFNGLYWHSDLFKSKDYHLNKTIGLEKIGVELLHIFEDEWVYTPNIVKSILKNKLNLTNKKIYARNCVLKLVKDSESKKFLESNHIQGGQCKNSVRLGLYHNDVLVSLMTFSKGRIALGGKSNEWELVRFCNILNTNVIGSASKLFKHFVKNYNPNKIISYSDIRLFNGGLYKTLGFTNISKSKPNYWYVMENKRYHRFAHRKNVLVSKGYDKTKSESQIMSERGYYRIYDCGNIRWEFTNFL